MDKPPTDEYLPGFGRGEDEDDALSDQSESDGECFDVKDIPDVNRTFRKTPLWESKELPPYDDGKAGPNKDAMPDGFMSFTPLQIFLLLFPLDTWRSIVVQTNLGVLRNQCGGAALTLHELFVWVALQIMMMRAWSGAQDAYWQGTGAFDASQYMSRRRFYWIKRYLRFSDAKQRVEPGEAGYDPLYLLRVLVDTFNFTFRKYWRLSEWVSLDEMMINFKGNNPFHRFVPRKPHPNGTKVHALCDAVFYFCVAILVDDNSTMTIPYIVNQLFEGNVVPGMHMITDRYYCCAALVAYCVAKEVGLIGSTMAIRFMAKHAFSGWSKEEAKRKPRGTFEVATNADKSVGCCIWKDKGMVRLTMTSSSTARTRVVRAERGKSRFKVWAPMAASEFDRYFHGVDRNDQLRGEGYGLALCFRAMKYTIKMFMGLLDIVMSNSWIIWRVLHPKDRKRHRHWMNDLAAEMLIFNPDGDPVYRPRVSDADERHMCRPLAKTKRMRKGVEVMERKMGNCAMCSDLKNGIRHRSTMGCAECNVPLHPGRCHHDWHSLCNQQKRKKKTRRRSLLFESKE